MKITKETIFTLNQEELCRVISKLITGGIELKSGECEIMDLSIGENGQLKQITFINKEETNI